MPTIEQYMLNNKKQNEHLVRQLERGECKKNLLFKNNSFVITSTNTTVHSCNYSNMNKGIMNESKRIEKNITKARVLKKQSSQIQIVEDNNNNMNDNNYRNDNMIHDYLYYMISKMLINNNQVFIGGKEASENIILTALLGKDNHPDFIIKKNKERTKTIIIEIYCGNKDLNEMKAKYSTINYFADVKIINATNFTTELQSLFSEEELNYLNRNFLIHFLKTIHSFTTSSDDHNDNPNKGSHKLKKQCSQMQNILIGSKGSNVLNIDISNTNNMMYDYLYYMISKMLIKNNQVFTTSGNDAASQNTMLGSLLGNDNHPDFIIKKNKDRTRTSAKKLIFEYLALISFKSLSLSPTPTICYRCNQ
ncbi:hypothetical protein ABK040_016688 [Willaertia magna]